MITKECNQLIGQKHVYGKNKDLLSEKENIKCNNIIKITKMSNFDDVTKENIIEHNPNWPQIPCKILTTEGSGSGKTNSLFNLVSQQPDIGNIYLLC